MPEVKTIPAKYIFIDIVGFTHNRSVEAQSDIIASLNDIIQTSIKEHGIKKDEVMFLSASDDICIALLNVGSPYDVHLHIALSIVGKVYRHSINTPNKMRKFEVRVGVNSYTDNLVTDINGNQNLAGAGVNLASHIMKMADGNQILISKNVFDDLRHHEKYASAFKLFRAKIREDVELPVYQFVSQGFEGLNVSIPASLRASVPTPSAPLKPAASPPPLPVTAQLPRVEPPREAPSRVEKPVFVTQSSITKTPPVNTQTEHTLSYLKGILPEPEKPETKAAPVQAKTESLHFLQQNEPKRSSSFIWAFAAILLLGGAALGAWYWMRPQPKPATSQPLANTATPAPSTLPVGNSTAAPNQTPSQTLAQKSEPAPSAAQTASPETKSSDSAPAFKPRAPQRRVSSAPRPVAQKSAPARSQPAAKPQPARASKPKSTKRVTLDDLIN